MNAIRKNGKVFKERICPVCARTHFHGDNMCVPCRNRQQEKRKKKYVRIKNTQWQTEKELRIEIHTDRVQVEMRAIQQAGLDPIKDSVADIIAAGVVLDGSFHIVDNEALCMALREAV